MQPPELFLLHLRKLPIVDHLTVVKLILLFVLFICTWISARLLRDGLGVRVCSLV